LLFPQEWNYKLLWEETLQSENWKEIQSRLDNGIISSAVAFTNHISKDEIKDKSLLALTNKKGGFGELHEGIFKNQKVAVKELNDEKFALKILSEFNVCRY
jgi:hypothetical protein